MASWQDVEQKALWALNASPRGQQALQSWLDAVKLGLDARVLVQGVRHNLGMHADYVMQRAWDVAPARGRVMLDPQVDAFTATSAVHPTPMRRR